MGFRKILKRNKSEYKCDPIKHFGVSLKTESGVKRAVVPAGYGNLLLLPLGEAAGSLVCRPCRGGGGQQREGATFRSGEVETWKEKASCEVIAVCGFVHIYKGFED